MNGTRPDIMIIDECCEAGEINHIPIEEQMVFINADYSKLEDLIYAQLAAERDAYITGLGVIYEGKHIDLADYLVPELCPFIKPQVKQCWEPRPVKKLTSAPQQSFRSRMRSVNRNR